MSGQTAELRFLLARNYLQRICDNMGRNFDAFGTPFIVFKALAKDARRKSL